MQAMNNQAMFGHRLDGTRLLHLSDASSCVHVSIHDNETVDGRCDDERRGIRSQETRQSYFLYH